MSNVCKKGRSRCEWSTTEVLYSRLGSWPYPKTLDCGLEGLPRTNTSLLWIFVSCSDKSRITLGASNPRVLFLWTDLGDDQLPTRSLGLHVNQQWWLAGKSWTLGPESCSQVGSKQHQGLWWKPKQGEHHRHNESTPWVCLIKLFTVVINSLSSKVCHRM